MLPTEIARFNDSQWPLVLIEWPKTMDQAGFDQFAREFDALLARKQPFAVVMIVEGVTPPSSQIRRCISDYQKTRVDQTSVYISRWAFVVESPLIKGVLTAIRWMVPAAYAEEHFTKLHEAKAWASAAVTAAPAT